MAKRVILSVVLCVAARVAVPDIIIDERIFRRGDANNDSYVNASDASYINAFLFLGGPEPGCLNQADANNDGEVNVSDSVYILDWLYQGGEEPPYPGPDGNECVADDDRHPGCETDPCS